MNRQPKMKFNHMSFPTLDVAAEVEFFEKYFGARLEFIDPGSGSALLKHGGTDIVLEGKKESVSWHRDFHFGFEFETKREVEALYEQFKAAGVSLESEVYNRIGRGSRFFGRTPGGVQFEITTREDMDPKWDASEK